MENKEINMGIYNQMAEVANEVFARILKENETIQPGSYTAAEIEKQFNITGKFSACHGYQEKLNSALTSESVRKIKEEYQTVKDSLGYWGESVNFYCGNFSCSIVRASIFAKMAQWESAFRIPSKSRVLFVKEEESEAIAAFNMTIPKVAKVLSEYASTDAIRPNMCKIYIDIDNKCAVASDTTVLGVYPVEIEEINGKITKLWIDPKVWKKIAGQAVKVEICNDGKLAKITGSKGEIYQCEQIKGNYPDYSRVLPKVNKDGLFQIAKTDIKKIQNFVKGLPKSRYTPAMMVKMKVAAYSDQGTITWEDLDYEKNKSLKFDIEGSPKINIEFGISSNNLYRMCNDWNGCVWYCSNVRPLIFDNEEGKCTISMPMQIETDWNEQLSCEVPALERKNYEIALAGIKGETKPQFYPIAVAETVIDFAGMVENAKSEILSKENDIREAIWNDFEQKLNDDIVTGISELVAITETLASIIKEYATREEKHNYADAGMQIMNYDQRMHSGPAYIEFSDDCKNWAGGDSEIIYQNQACNEVENHTSTEWEEAWGSEYVAPIEFKNIDIVLNLFTELATLSAIVEMCRKAMEIERIGKGAGIVYDDIPASAPEPESDIPESQLTEIVTIHELCENDEKMEIVGIGSDDYTTDSGTIQLKSIRPAKGKLKTLFRKVREVAAIFF